MGGRLRPAPMDHPDRHNARGGRHDRQPQSGPVDQRRASIRRETDPHRRRPLASYRALRPGGFRGRACQLRPQPRHCEHVFLAARTDTTTGSFASVGAGCIVYKNVEAGAACAIPPEARMVQIKTRNIAALQAQADEVLQQWRTEHGNVA
jgi:hypothetical protein